MTFTEQEKKTIAALVKSNQLLKAQDLVLTAIEGQVIGVAQAMAKTPAGQWKQIKNLLGNVSEELGKRILPLFNMIGGAVLTASKGVMALADAIYGVSAALGGWPMKVLAVAALIGGLLTGFGLLPAGIFAAIVFAKELGEAIKWAGEQAAHIVEWVQVLAQHWRTVFGIISEGILIVATDWVAVGKAGAFAFGYIAGAATKAMMGFLIWLAGEFNKLAVAFGLKLVGIAVSVASVADKLLSGDVVGSAIAINNLLANAAKGIKAAGLETVDAVLKANQGFRQGLGMGGDTPDFGFSEINEQRIANINKMIDSLVAEKRKLEGARGAAFKLPDMPGKLKVEQEATMALDIKGGLSGLPDAWSQLQEAMLKQSDPQKEMAKGIGAIEDIQNNALDEIIKINQNGVKLQGLALA